MLPPSMRASDTDRDAVAGVLRNAGADGRLAAGELDERLVRLEQARTYGDLDDVVKDLTTTLPSEFLDPNPPPDPQPVDGPERNKPGYRPEDRLVIDAGWGQETRRGVWTVPPYVSLRAGAGSIELDFTFAQVSSDVISMDIAGGMGSVTLIVPPGWGVDLDRLSKGIGSVTTKVTGHAEGRPLLQVSGRMVAGYCIAREPDWWERRRHRRIAKELDADHGRGPTELPPTDLR